MIGTIVNVIAIILGSLLGMTIKKGIPENIKDGVTRMLGISVIIVSINGIITSMVKPVYADATLSSDGGIILLVSLVLGYVIGELLLIDDKINNIGALLENKLNMDGFAAGFINASIIFCVGAMSIIGAVNDGLYGDHTILFIKSGLDFITSLIIASSMGIGVLLSFIPVLLLQGGISLGAGLLAAVLSDALINSICMIGYAIVGCIGIQFLGYSKIKIANMLPALVVPIIWHIIKGLI